MPVKINGANGPTTAYIATKQILVVQPAYDADMKPAGSLIMFRSGGFINSVHSPEEVLGYDPDIPLV
jgi:hypothetical protein